MEMDKRHKPRSRFAAAEAAAENIECSGATCRSCTAVAVADCIALGCCPCALVSVLALALVRLPWEVARRCLGTLRRKGVRRLGRRRVRDEGGAAEKVAVAKESLAAEVMKRKEWEDQMGGLLWGGGDAGQGAAAPRILEGDRVWMELYQIGQWGFGRLSFSGIQGREIGPEAIAEQYSSLLPLPVSFGFYLCNI